MPLRRLFTPLLLVVLAGCRYLPGNDDEVNSMVTGPAYDAGILSVEDKVDLQTAHHAALQGLRFLQIEVTENRDSAEGGHIVGQTQDRQPVIVELAARGAGRTRLSISVADGEEARSRMILEQIRQHYPPSQ